MNNYGQNAATRLPKSALESRFMPETSRDPTEIEKDQRDPNSFCLGCGTEMYGRGCKLRCPRCGYFEDCTNLLGINAEANADF